MTPPARWIEECPVRAFEVDARERLTLPALCNFLQEAASNHAHALRLDVHQLHEGHQVTWVLSRLRVHVTRYPRWRERVRVETWPSEYSRLFAWREFRVSDAAGESLALGTSRWVIIDVATRRPVRLPPFVIERLPPPAERALSDAGGKLPGAGGQSSRREFHVRYGDLDVNQHVNHVNYIAWACEAAPVELLRGASVRELSVDFINEAQFGDRVASLVDEAAEGESGEASGARVLQHGLRRMNGDEDELCRVRTRWEMD